MKGFSRDEANLEELITSSEKKGLSLCLLRGFLGWTVGFLCDYKHVEIWEVIAQGLDLLLELSYATQT